MSVYRGGTRLGIELKLTDYGVSGDSPKIELTRLII
jgi:hypothetical protein